MKGCVFSTNRHRKFPSWAKCFPNFPKVPENGILFAGFLGRIPLYPGILKGTLSTSSFLLPRAKYSLFCLFFNFLFIFSVKKSSCVQQELLV